MLAAVEPGRSTLDLDRVAERYIRAQGATPSFKGYRGTYPASICTSIDAEIVHGIPSATRKLKEGMVLSLDFGAILDGFHGDAAVTVFVGGQAPSEEAAKLAKETEHALYAAIDAIRVGGRLSDIGHTIESVAEAAGLGVVREYGGHGIGRSMHEEPKVPNFVTPEQLRGDFRLKVGTTIAVEPMVVMGRREVVLLDDQWTVVTEDRQPAAHFEHTIAVTEAGCEILTNGSANGTKAA